MQKPQIFLLSDMQSQLRVPKGKGTIVITCPNAEPSLKEKHN